MSKKRLGRGLDALLSSSNRPAAPVSTNEPTAAESQQASVQTPKVTAPDRVKDGTLTHVAVTSVGPSPFQPRREFDDAALDDLAASIKTQGLMQPLVVRPRPGQRFELIAGERRLRAAQRAGLKQVPVVVREVDDRAASAMALIENIQREDLNPLEEAMAYERLKAEFALTQQQIADTVGKSRTAVANMMRLLNLAPKVRDLLANGDLDMGHARALLSLAPLDQERAAAEVIEKGLSARQAEALVRRWQAGAGNGATSGSKDKSAAPDADVAVLERELSDKLGAPVRIRQSARGRGEVSIAFSSLDELDGVLAHLR